MATSQQCLLHVAASPQTIAQWPPTSLHHHHQWHRQQPSGHIQRPQHHTRLETCLSRALSTCFFLTFFFFSFTLLIVIYRLTKSILHHLPPPMMANAQQWEKWRRWAPGMFILMFLTYSTNVYIYTDYVYETGWQSASTTITITTSTNTNSMTTTAALFSSPWTTAAHF